MGRQILEMLYPEFHRQHALFGFNAAAVELAHTLVVFQPHAYITAQFIGGLLADAAAAVIPDWTLPPGLTPAQQAHMAAQVAEILRCDHSTNQYRYMYGYLQRYLPWMGESGVVRGIEFLAGTYPILTIYTP